ncbi:signal peptidase I [Undibacterium sp. TS12]|uniref:signal peptidase I n=1 Tax=Undibacterium sp. TS12 TaxID=2908202 RepID=UPI001F4C6E16|nr:signal peptidase I [Undibacterium sp. TS12]MCH8618916.1 signal peptidase I [Undibacterium sp. TS12]
MQVEKKRSPLFSAFLNLLSPGLGFLYLNRIALAIAAIAFMPVVFFLGGRSGWILSPKGFLVVSVVFVGGWLGMAAWAYLIARKQKSIKLGPFQRGYIYIGFTIIVGVSLTLVTAFRGVLFGYDVFRMPSASMEATLLVGDDFISNTQAFSHRVPRRGEVVVFRDPRQSDIKYVQRVIGLPGEKITFRDGRVFANGILVPDSYIEQKNNTGLHQTTSEFEVGTDSYFLLGDNRDNSADSRYWGSIPAKYLYGSVEFIYFSFGEGGVRWERIGRRMKD